jgi:hypothetical protein
VDPCFAGLDLGIVRVEPLCPALAKVGLLGFVSQLESRSARGRTGFGGGEEIDASRVKIRGSFKGWVHGSRSPETRAGRSLPSCFVAPRAKPRYDPQPARPGSIANEVSDPFGRGRSRGEAEQIRTAARRPHREASERSFPAELLGFTLLPSQISPLSSVAAARGPLIRLVFFGFSRGSVPASSPTS